MRFEWDDNKAASNELKHGITFEEAITVFADPYLLFTEDSQHSHEEEREWAIGEAENGLIVVVVFTMRGERLRIISARKATKRECQKYESGI
ncbi:BrnT family toxin [Pseudanabaenaceae cyanobacterium LEGE 13415]|nr:BrnT family toxin [Pseudanabaenaceae cyanobacterium LEGE 13415]